VYWIAVHTRAAKQGGATREELGAAAPIAAAQATLAPRICEPA